jgi:thymidylate kinase
MPVDAPEFAVLLGPDFAGKSSALAELRAHSPAWRVVSTDQQFLDSKHSLIAVLRHGVADLLPSLGRDYSPEFLAGLLQTAVLHLRDQIVDVEARGPTVVDSYYYKILAKCHLAGIQDNPMFTWWRSFPQPRRVIYLQVSEKSAWRRCGEGARLNRLEYHGDRPNQDGFARYQRTLDTLMREEIRHLPVTFVAEQATPARTAWAIQEALTHELV